MSSANFRVLSDAEYDTLRDDRQKRRYLRDLLEFQAEEYKENYKDLQGQIRTLNRRVQAAHDDSYDYQKKAQGLENEVVGLRQELGRIKHEAPREIGRLNGQLKRMAKETQKLQHACGHKDDAIERIKRDRERTVADLMAEMKEIDGMLARRNEDVNRMGPERRELVERVSTLEHNLEVERRTADVYKEKAEKYDAAGPALERLNAILGRYLGEQLKDGLDWPPGHPNHKMNQALDALEDELRKASLKDTTGASTPVATAEQKVGTQDDDVCKPTGSQHYAPVSPFSDPAASEREHSSSPLTFKDALSASFHGHSAYESKFIPESPLKPQFQGGINQLTPKDEAAKDVRSLKNIFDGQQQMTPTPGEKAKRPGVNTAVSGGRNFSLFGNATSAADDDSPKPSEKLFGELDPRRRGAKNSRFTPRSEPEPAETKIVYRDREVEKIVEKIVQVPARCERLHVEDCPKTHIEDMDSSDEEEREREKIIEYVNREVKVPVPCQRAHVDDFPTPPTAEMKPTATQTDMQRTVIAEYERLLSLPPAVPEPVTKYLEKEVIKVVPQLIYQDRTIYRPRHPLTTLFYFYYDTYICLVEWAYRHHHNVVEGVEKWAQRWLGEKVAWWLVGRALVGGVFEMVHWEDDEGSLVGARHAVLRRMGKEPEADTVGPEPQASKPKTKTKTQTVTADPTQAPPLEQVQQTSMKGKAPLAPPAPQYTTTTQYTIHRPLFISNALASLLTTLALPTIFFALLIAIDHVNLLAANGVVIPSWYTLPWNGDGGGYDGGEGEGEGGWVVDRDWNWLQYFWKALTGGWWRQMQFYLATTASGGAGYRMPG